GSLSAGAAATRRGAGADGVARARAADAAAVRGEAPRASRAWRAGRRDPPLGGGRACRPLGHRHARPHGGQALLPRQRGGARDPPRALPGPGDSLAFGASLPSARTSRTGAGDRRRGILGDRVAMVPRELAEVRGGPRGPGYVDLDCVIVGAQTEMLDEALLGEVRGAGGDHPRLPTP